MSVQDNDAVTFDDGAASAARTLGPGVARRLASIRTLRQPDALRALLVDHDGDTRQLHAGYLRLATWNVDEASDGPEALAKAIEAPPSIIVTDTRLPGISGYDLCDILKRDPITQRVPLVVLTADAMPADALRARMAGADAVLLKPCTSETLLAEVHRAIEQSHQLLERSAAVRAKVAVQVAQSAALIDTSGRQRPRTLSRTLNRHDTDTPPLAPPPMLCPECDRLLAYRRSHIGGVNARQSEQWDYYECSNGCGTFQYRERTRKLRKVL